MMVFAKPVGDGQDEVEDVFVNDRLETDAPVGERIRAKNTRLHSSTDLTVITIGKVPRELQITGLKGLYKWLCIGHVVISVASHRAIYGFPGSKTIYIGIFKLASPRWPTQAPARSTPKCPVVISCALVVLP